MQSRKMTPDRRPQTRRLGAGFKTSIGLGLGIGISACLGGCADPASAPLVRADQHRLVETIAHRHAHDASLVRSLADTLLGIRRTLALGALERELIARGYIAPDATAGIDGFDRDIADPARATALVLEVRAGRMTRDDAVSFLRDYALAYALTDGAALRREMLARLAPIERHDRMARHILEALDARSAESAAIYADLARTNEALARAAYVSAFDEPADAPALRDIWTSVLENVIDDPRERRAAIDLLTAIVPGAGPGAGGAP